MEVPIINRRISDLNVGINTINDPTGLSRGFAVPGVGKLHQVYSLWKWGALLLLAFLASFTSLPTRIKTLVFRLRNVNISLPSSSSTLLVCDYDSDSDWSFSSNSSDEEDVDDDEEEEESDNGDSRVKRFGYYHDNDGDKGINGNVPWLQRCGNSFGDLLDLGSSGVVKLWDNLDFKGEGSHVASFLSKCSSFSLLSPAVLLAAEKKGSEDDVEMSAWDSRVGFGVPALLAAEWKQPGRLLGKIIRVDRGDVGDDVGGDIIVGDMRMANGALTELTETEVNRMVRRRGRRH